MCSGSELDSAPRYSDRERCKLDVLSTESWRRGGGKLALRLLPDVVRGGSDVTSAAASVLGSLGSGGSVRSVLVFGALK